jgi:hypothetical protein
MVLARDAWFSARDVADVADGQSGARADVLVGKFVVEFQPDQFAAAVVERLQAQPHLADAFHADDLFVGQRRGIGGVGTIFIFIFEDELSETIFAPAAAG